jgi:O-antigen biosynthesis protein WbqP
MLSRVFDLVLSLLAAMVLILPTILICLAIKATSEGKVLYWSKRVGYNSQYFMMPKFRSMYSHSPEVATDKLKDPQRYITSVGSFLRRTSLDEIPQLISVLMGDMSIVGPRPALHNQHLLISKRQSLGIDSVRPGITGWAQINGRDEISLNQKVNLDFYYIEQKSLFLDFKILLLTIKLVLWSRGVKH